jgi:hypothetical protein
MKLKDENQTDIITDQHSPDLGQAHESRWLSLWHLPHIRPFYNKSLARNVHVLFIQQNFNSSSPSIERSTLQTVSFRSVSFRFAWFRFVSFGFVSFLDAKETITYSSPIKKNRKTKRKLLLKNTVETSMNDEYTHSMQSPLEGPKYFKKICTKSEYFTNSFVSFGFISFCLISLRFVRFRFVSTSFRTLQVPIFSIQISGVLYVTLMNFTWFKFR